MIWMVANVANAEKSPARETPGIQSGSDEEMMSEMTSHATIATAMTIRLEIARVRRDSQAPTVYSAMKKPMLIIRPSGTANCPHTKNPIATAIATGTGWRRRSASGSVQSPRPTTHTQIGATSLYMPVR